jgi:hypothetical protein
VCKRKNFFCDPKVIQAPKMIQKDGEEREEEEKRE